MNSVAKRTDQEQKRWRFSYSPARSRSASEPPAYYIARESRLSPHLLQKRHLVGGTGRPLCRQIVEAIEKLCAGTQRGLIVDIRKGYLKFALGAPNNLISHNCCSTLRAHDTLFACVSFNEIKLCIIECEGWQKNIKPYHVSSIC